MTYTAPSAPWQDLPSTATPVPASWYTQVDGTLVDLDNTRVPNVESVVAANSQAALAVLRAQLTGRDFGPRVIVCAGDSNTYGYFASTNANRWVNRLTTMLQARYPKSGGGEVSTYNDLATAFGAVGSLANGITLVNAGVPGATADAYIDDTSRPEIAALNPCLVTHMVGFNSSPDASTSDPAFYKAQFRIQLAKLKALLTQPCVHLLVISFRTATGSGSYGTRAAQWAAFATALQDLCAEDPDGDVYWANFTDVFTDAGVLNGDPAGLIGPSDHAHMSNQGHAFIASLFYDVINNAPTMGGAFTPATGTLNSGSAPTVTGTAQQGATLTAVTSGSWSPTPDTTLLQWLRGGVGIAGATSTTYTLTSSDVGWPIIFRATAYKSGCKAAAATSAATSDVVDLSSHAPRVISAVGSLHYGTSLGLVTSSVSPVAVGNVLVLGTEVGSSTTHVSSISGGGVASWAKLAGPFVNPVSNRNMEIWWGKVTTAGSSTITLTHSASVTGVRVDIGVQEFTSAAGTSATWTADGSGGSSSTEVNVEVTYPALTAAGNHRLYFGYAAVSGAVTGSETVSSGYALTADASGNAWVWGVDVNRTQTPQVNTDQSFGAVAGLLVATG